MNADLAWIHDKCKVIFASWRLILVGALSLALLGGILVFLTSERTYKSRMILPLSPRVLGLIKTAAVLDPVIASRGHLPVSEYDRELLASRVIVSAETSRGSGLYNVSVDGPTPAEAKRLLEKLLEEIFRFSKPSGWRREKILAEIKSLNGTVADLKKLSQRLNDNAAQVDAGTSGELYARAFVFLLSDTRAQERRISELTETLEGLHRDDVVVRPTLATTPEPRGLARKLIVVSGAAFFFMCLFVLFREEWFRSSDAAVQFRARHC